MKFTLHEKVRNWAVTKEASFLGLLFLRDYGIIYYYYYYYIITTLLYFR